MNSCTTVIIAHNIFCSLSGPLPPQNLSISHITTTSALVTWDHHPRSLPDGFVVNITRGLNTRSRYLPEGSLGTYTLRDLIPGQHYRLTLTAVRKTGQDSIHSVPQHLAFATREFPVCMISACLQIVKMLPSLWPLLCILYCTVPVRSTSRGDRPQGGQDYQMGQTLTQVQDGGTDENTELLEEPLR